MRAWESHNVACSQTRETNADGIHEEWGGGRTIPLHSPSFARCSLNSHSLSPLATMFAQFLGAYLERPYVPPLSMILMLGSPNVGGEASWVGNYRSFNSTKKQLKYLFK